MNNVYLVGDSHIGCVATAYKTMIKGTAEPPSYKLFTHSLGGGAVAYDLLMQDSRSRRVLNPLLRAAVTASNAHHASQPVGARSVLAVCVGGYVSSVYTWDKESGAFDLLDSLLPEQSVANDLMFVPRSLVKESLTAHFKGLVEAMVIVRNRAKMPVMYVVPPPPYKQNTEIVRRMAERRGVAVDSVPQPMPAAVRLKVWNLAREVLRDQLKSLAIPFFDVPGGSVDEGGFLREELYGDGFHAGAAYGTLVLRDIVASGQAVSSGL